VEDFSSRHADERVVHLGCAVGLQWRDILVVFAIESRRRSIPRGRLCSRGSGALWSPHIVLHDLGCRCLCGSLERRDGGSVCGTRKVARALEGLDGACACLLHYELNTSRRTIMHEYKRKACVEDNTKRNNKVRSEGWQPLPFRLPVRGDLLAHSHTSRAPWPM
jgi:hypothetical protein